MTRSAATVLEAGMNTQRPTKCGIHTHVDTTEGRCWECDLSRLGVRHASEGGDVGQALNVARDVLYMVNRHPDDSTSVKNEALSVLCRAFIELHVVKLENAHLRSVVSALREQVGYDRIGPETTREEGS